MININELSYEVDDKVILQNMTCNIKKNKITGIIGPNGSGKTTFLKHIYKEIPSKNKIYLDNKLVELYDSKNFSRKMSVLIQENNLNKLNLTVFDFCLMGRYPYKKLFEDYNKEDFEIVEFYLNKTNILHYKDRYVNTLSGGEKQRVMITRAFVQETEYIALDEPTNHLDIKVKIELMEILKNINKTIIVTLHDIDLALKFCDEVMIIKNGKLCSFGNTEDIIQEEILNPIFEVDFKIINIDGQKIIYY